MKGGKKHPEASPLSDKIVFSKVCDMTSSYITFYIFKMTFKHKGKIIIFSFMQIKQGLGGNVRIILSGAAPLAPHVEAFLKVVTCRSSEINSLSIPHGLVI